MCPEPEQSDYACASDGKTKQNKGNKRCGWKRGEIGWKKVGRCGLGWVERKWKKGGKGRGGWYEVRVVGKWKAGDGVGIGWMGWSDQRNNRLDCGLTIADSFFFFKSPTDGLNKWKGNGVANAVVWMREQAGERSRHSPPASINKAGISLVFCVSS